MAVLPLCIRAWPIFITANWWLRSPNTNSATNAWNINTNGNANNNNTSNTSNGPRPALMVKPDRVGFCAQAWKLKAALHLIKGGRILLPVCVQAGDKHIMPMPVAFRCRGLRTAFFLFMLPFYGDGMTFETICSFESLYKAYKRARIGKRKRQATAQYEANVIFATERLAYILASKKYIPSKFEMFYVYEPKKRLVQAPAFVDKVVQHALVDNLLYAVITRSFIRDSSASQIGKGTHVGLNRLKFHMIDYFRKRKGRDEENRKMLRIPLRPMAEWSYAQGWVLKADIRKFFASINHDIVKAMLRKRVEDDKVFDLMCTYIDCTDGLPLGYQTSQLLALMYLDDFDHWIKERLRIKYYGRYMDDFYLIHESKDHLRYCWKEINRYMADLKLELNEKTDIFPLRNGIDFLGYHSYLTETGKVVRKIRNSSVKRMKARIKRWRYELAEGTTDLKHIWNSYQAWDAHAAHGNTRKLRITIKKLMSANFKEV